MRKQSIGLSIYIITVSLMIVPCRTWAITRSSISTRNLINTEDAPSESFVEYLEATGTQWIDTGIRGASPMVIELGVQMTAGAGDKTIIGTGGNGNRIYFGVYAYKWFFGYSDYVFGTSIDFKKHDVVINFLPNNAYATVDGTEVARIDKNIGVSYQYTMALFSRNLGPNTQHTYCMSGKIFYCRIYFQGNLVRDFVPYRFLNESGEKEGAMYDRVSDTLFRNQGIGAFLIGPDVKGE